jgi:hypothetical protein
MGLGLAFLAAFTIGAFLSGESVRHGDIFSPGTDHGVPGIISLSIGLSLGNAVLVPLFVRAVPASMPRAVVCLAALFASVGSAAIMAGGFWIGFATTYPYSEDPELAIASSWYLALWLSSAAFAAIAGLALGSLLAVTLLRR